MHAKTQLMQHQKDAFNKIKGIRVGALFMDMGTGKTRTAIELVVHREYRISNVVYFCPVSLKETVRQELLKHTNLKTRNIHIFDESTNTSNVPSVFIYIVGIESMSNSKRTVLAANKIINGGSFVIVDESSYIKTFDAWRSVRITELSKECKYRLLLTGTPITNNVQDLYSQMKFLSQKILGYNSFYSFAYNHLEYSSAYPYTVVRSHNAKHIAKKISPYVYQITKEECLDLPEKKYKNLWFRMTAKQHCEYDYVKNKFLNQEYIDGYVLFQLFSALQQIVSGFCNATEIVFKNNNRIELLDDVLPSAVGNVVIWCKYMYSVDLIRNCVKKCSVLHGQQVPKERSRQLNLFGSENNILISTFGVGSHGLNLTQAHTVIFYENSFNYAQRIQAEDRCHRIGQTNDVLYIDIACSNSIDGLILKCINKKENIISAFKRNVELVKEL